MKRCQRGGVLWLRQAGRQGRLISQSRSEGERLTRSISVSAWPPGAAETTERKGQQPVRGQQKGRQVFSKEPLTCDLFSLYSRDHFRATFKWPHQVSGAALMLSFSDTHSFAREEEWVVVTDRRRQKSQGFAGCAQHSVTPERQFFT